MMDTNRDEVTESAEIQICKVQITDITLNPFQPRKLFDPESLEELAAYKEGKAPFHLLYELSFLKDLAKWCFLQEQQGEEFKVILKTDDKKFPSNLYIDPLISISLPN